MKGTSENYLHGVLYPTDFTTGSLAGLRTYLERHDGSALRLFLVHGYTAPDSISELLFFSPASVAHSLADEKFLEGCAVLRNRFAFIASLGHTVFTGKTQSAFDSFTEGYGIREAVFLHGYSAKNRNSRCFDLGRFIKDSSLKITQINAPYERVFSGKRSSTLAELFPHSPVR